MIWKLYQICEVHNNNKDWNDEMSKKNVEPKLTVNFVEKLDANRSEQNLKKTNEYGYKRDLKRIFISHAACVWYAQCK